MKNLRFNSTNRIYILPIYEYLIFYSYVFIQSIIFSKLKFKINFYYSKLNLTFSNSFNLLMFHHEKKKTIGIKF